MRLLEAIQVILEHLLSVFPGLVSAFNQVKGQKKIGIALWRMLIWQIGNQPFFQ